MADSLPVIRHLPDQIAYVGALFQPLYLSDDIENCPQDMQFSCSLKDGSVLPSGLSCTNSGIFTGVPAIFTSGEYTLSVTATSATTHQELQFEFKLSIKPGIAADTAVSPDTEFFSDLKQRVWQSLGADFPLPDLGNPFDRPVSQAEVYYLLERFATLIIWNADDLRPAGKLQAIQLKGMSELFHIYDRETCLVATPKNLFDHKRTRHDAMQTATAMAREVYDRGWAIEFGGFNPMVRRVWVEVQRLGAQNNKPLTVYNYEPSDIEMSLAINYKTNSTRPNMGTQI